mmetsp:Transcript_62544/g.73141  ORF Transcript_62544/g.73141 Transcript_62544/m.73141 type:complete len:625 (-) Transcript_62544:361-2235(-)
MNVLYASVGTAIHITQGVGGVGRDVCNKSNSDNGTVLSKSSSFPTISTAVDEISSTGSNTSNSLLPAMFINNNQTKQIKWMAIAAAATYYHSLSFPSTTSNKLSQSLSSPEFCNSLIQRAWGVLSSPYVKRLSLKMSQLWKRSGVVERVDLCGVTCYVIIAHDGKRDEMIQIALKRMQRKQTFSDRYNNRTRRSSGRRHNSMSNLSTIVETTSETYLEEEITNNSNRGIARNVPLQKNGEMRSKNVLRHEDNGYPLTDVILHLTGGGFFAHTIAGDLPYLMDWSRATNAIIVCPEYALLPEYKFPVALNQIYDIYRFLHMNGREGDPPMGFRTHKIIVTGESSGGNLAAALCVKLCMDNRKCANRDNSDSDDDNYSQDTVSENDNNMMKISDIQASSAMKLTEDTATAEVTAPLVENGPPLCSEIKPHTALTTDHVFIPESSSQINSTNIATSSTKNYAADSAIPLPNALMLCCPILNLSLYPKSPSRIIGASDPVLPSGLLEAISEAYVPSSIPSSSDSDTILDTVLVVSKKDPIASPYFAPDDVLSCFPSTRLFSDSTDPLLDDAVDFNTRLRRLGVDSNLRAVHNMPHAYWGLGIVGCFPEAEQVQQECEEFLIETFSHSV